MAVSGKRILVNTCLMALSCVVALLMAEGIVRLFLPQSLILLRPDVFYPISGLGWNRAPNLDTTVNFGGGGPVRLITDNEGNRIGMSGKVQNPERRILAIGDSFTEALQVDYEQTMTALLEAAITQRTGKRTEVVCAGVAGWGPSHYLMQSRARLATSKYDLQLVFFYLGNDVEPSRTDQFPPRDPEPYHYLRWPRELTSKEFIDAVMFPINDWLEIRSQAFILFRNRAQPILAQLGLTALSIPSVFHRSNIDQPWWDNTADTCLEIEKTGERYGIPTIFVLIPPSFSFTTEPLHELGFDPQTMDLLQPYKLMKPMLEARDLQVVDLMPSFEARTREGGHCYGKVDTHFSAEGHRLAAETILPAVMAPLAASGVGPGANAKGAAEVPR